MPSCDLFPSVAESCRLFLYVARGCVVLLTVGCLRPLWVSTTPGNLLKFYNTSWKCWTSPEIWFVLVEIFSRANERHHGYPVIEFSFVPVTEKLTAPVWLENGIKSMSIVRSPSSHVSLKVIRTLLIHRLRCDKQQAETTQKSNGIFLAYLVKICQKSTGNLFGWIRRHPACHFFRCSVHADCDRCLFWLRDSRAAWAPSSVSWLVAVPTGCRPWRLATTNSSSSSVSRVPAWRLS